MALKEYFRTDTNKSSMRLGFLMIVFTVCFIGVGATVGFLLGIYLNRDIALISAGIGALAGLVGAMLIPAFGGKVGQTITESKVVPAEKNVDNPDQK